MSKRKIIIISTISVIFLILISIVLFTVILKPNDTAQTATNTINEEKSNKISLKAKASGKILKFSVSLENINNVEFSIEKSYNEGFETYTEVANSSNNTQADDDLTVDLENGVKKCYYRVKAKNTENGEVVYSNVITITLKNSSSNGDDEPELGIEESVELEKEDLNVENSENKNNQNTNSENTNNENEDVSDNWYIEDGIEEDYTNDVESDEATKNENLENNYIPLNIESTEVEYISLSESEIDFDLSKYNTTTLIASIGPSSAKNKTITWTSSNTKVATVEQNGKVTAISNGTATITAKTSNGKSEKCEVDVTTSPTSISLNKTSISLDMLNKREETLIASLSPSTSSDKTVMWTSSNENVAIVDSNGTIIASANGTTTIKAETPNGKSVTCQVNITTSGSGVYLNKTLASLDLNNSKQVSLKATIVPSSTVNKTITWSSSNNNIAVVDSNGLVTAKSSGTAIITAKTSNGKTATCKIVIKVLPTKITLNKTTLDLNLKNNKANLVATVLPTNTTDKTVKWSSSDSNIASVDSNGNITAKKNGKVTITATCGNVSASCNVKIMYKKGLTQQYDSNSGFYYWLYIPDMSAIEDLSKIPLIIYLHGNGQTGYNQLDKLKNGNTLVKLLAEDTSFTKYGGIIIAPQSRAPWVDEDLDNIKALADNIVSNYGICKDKISVIGHSRGASAAWNFSMKYPNFVSCAGIISGYSDYYRSSSGLHTKIPIWVITGSRDTDSLKYMSKGVLSFKNHGGKIQFTLVSGYGHGIETLVHKKYNIIDWMLKQNKSTFNYKNYSF